MTEQTTINENNELDFVNDFGNFDIPDIDLDLFDFMPDEIADTENRYVKPKLIPMRDNQVMYDNAVRFAKEIELDKGCRYDAIVSGSFIFGDFIEALLTEKNVKAENMMITTLSLSQENIDSLHNLLVNDYIGNLNIIVSDYFYSHERHCLVPYMYEQLDIDNRFQLAVAFVHTKTVHFDTAKGNKFVIHGSANLRTSGNCEQFTIEENPTLHDFYSDRFNPILERFATIRKTAPRRQQWRDMTIHKFNQ